MFPLDTPAACLAAVPLAIVAAGPDNILAIGRGPRRGRATAIMSPMGAVLAFIPQFVSAGRGSVSIQMLLYGAIFAVLTAIVFSVLGSYASGLSGWLARRPRATTWLNVGAGATFVASGISILALGNRR